MLEEISLIQAMVNSGPAVLLACGLVVVWRTWRSDCQSTKDELDKLRALSIQAQEKRLIDAESMSIKYQDLALKVKESAIAVENFTRIVEKILVKGASNGS